jgi:hypothetical protein
LFDLLLEGDGLIQIIRARIAFNQIERKAVRGVVPEADGA